MNKTLFAFAAVLAATQLPAQTWTPLAYPPFTNVNSARRAGGTAYDLLNARVLFYGGLQSSPTLTLDETWGFDGTTWTQLTPATTPPPRWGHRMVLDTRRLRIVTFGGRSPTTTATANDTWEWDGFDWAQVQTQNAPSPRAFYSMAFDERRGVTVLYGTQSGATIGTSGGDQTWEYDGTDWAQVATPTTPPGLETPAMAYDKGRGVVVMFGGWNGLSPGVMYDRTYEYDGVDWTLRTTATTPTARYRAGCVYDESRGRIVLYGGFGNATALQDTWEYDGNDWTQVATAGPARSTEAFVVYDPILRQTYHFGGSGPGATANENWSYTGPFTAIAAPFGQGCALSSGVPELQATSLPVLGGTYALNIANVTASAPFAFVAHGLSNRTSRYGPLPLSLTAAGLPGCRLEVSDDAAQFVPNVGTFTASFGIPNQPALAGAQVFSQAFVFEPLAPGGLGVTSRAMHAVLGQ